MPANPFENQSIYSLTSVTSLQRDRLWESQFLAQLPQAKIKVQSETPQKGPDGWPYMMIEIHEQGDSQLMQLTDWLADKGIGLVINAHKGQPDDVLTYGMIWNFRETKEFRAVNPNPLPAITSEFSIAEGTKVHAGPPSKEYLPDYAKSILKNFFKDNGIENMKVLVTSTDRIHYDFCFSLESLNNPPPSEHEGVLEAISWFLPDHYSLALVSEKGLPAFHTL